VEDGRAVGVELKNGKIIRARKAVVSNATPFDTVKMLKPDDQVVPEAVHKWRSELGKLPRHGAIMHLFLAIDAKDLDLSHIQDPAHLVVQDWGRSLQVSAGVIDAGGLMRETRIADSHVADTRIAIAPPSALIRTLSHPGLSKPVLVLHP